MTTETKKNEMELGIESVNVGGEKAVYRQRKK
jgi:hypothetical protein